MRPSSSPRAASSSPASAQFRPRKVHPDQLHGTEGGVLIDDVLEGTMRVFGKGLAEKLASIENDTHSIAEDVVRAVEDGRPLRVNGREGRRTVALLEAIYASGRQGRPLTLGR